MKTFKKLFAYSAIFALLATMMPTYANAASYDAELTEAYAYAKNKGITTMTSIDNADMYGNLTRVAMAKMVANYVLDLGLQELDTDKECNFPDVSASLDEAYDNGVTKACQLGLMGVGIEKFNPNGIVTRAEFGTVLSRALWGDEYNGADPYYKDHLQALKDEGIMNIIDNPNMKEVRGYVMLMMQRADEDYTPAVGCSAEELLACIVADDFDACIAACSGQDEEDQGPVKSGDLAVTVAKNDGAVAFIGGTSELDFITFKGSERITLNKVSLERYGFSNYADVESVWLENENGEVVTTPKSLNSKDKVDLTIKREFRDSKEATYAVVVELNTGASAAGTIGFKVVDAESSAKNLVLPKGNANLYSMVEYNGSEITLNEKGTPRNYYYSEKETYEVARLQVKASNANIEVNGFTLTNSGNLDLGRYLDDVVVLRDNVAMKNVTYSVKNEELRVNFAKDTVEARKNALYTVKVKLVGLDRFGQTIEFRIDNGGDFGAVEAKTNARVSFTNSTSTFPVFPVYTFNGDKITLTNGKLASTVYGAAGSTDVVIAEGTVTLNEAIKLNSFDIVASGTGIEEMRIAFGNDEYDGVRQSDKKTFRFSNVYIEKSGDVKIKADLYDDAVGTYSFTPNSIQLGTIGGKYDEHNQTIDSGSFVGSLKLSSLRAEAARGSLDNKITKEQEIKKEDATRVVIFDGDYSARRDGVELNQFVVKNILSGGSASSDYVNFYLSVDGDEVAFIDTLNVEEYFDGVEIKDGKTVKVKLEAEFYLSNVGTYQYDLTLRGEDDNGNTVGNATDSTVKVKVVNQGSVVVTETPKVHLKDTVVKKSSDIELARFMIKADEYSAVTDLEQLKFKFVGATTTGDIRIKVDGTDETVNLTESSDVYELEGINYDLTDGVEIIITHRSELTSNPTAYELELQEVNNTSKVRKYTRKVVDALVKVGSQSNTDDETKFIFSVDKESTDTITGVVLKAGVTLTGGTIAGEVQNNDFVEVANDPDAVKYIDEIEYWVNGTKVTITKAAFNDYFRVGDTYAKVARAK